MGLAPIIAKKELVFFARVAVAARVVFLSLCMARLISNARLAQLPIFRSLLAQFLKPAGLLAAIGRRVPGQRPEKAATRLVHSASPRTWHLWQVRGRSNLHKLTIGKPLGGATQVGRSRSNPHKRKPDPSPPRRLPGFKPL